MKKLKRVGVLSVGKVTLLFGVLFGLFLGLTYAFVPSTAVPMEFDPNLAQFIFSPWAILIFPVFYAIAYFIVGIICATLYNLFARWVGGIELNIA